MTRFGLLLLVSAVLACSSGDSVERSAEAFCSRYQELADAHDADVKTVAVVEQSSPDEVRSLAERAPDDELESALEDIATTQAEVIEMMDAVQSGDLAPQDVDRELIDSYGKAGQLVHEARHRLCDG